MELPIWAQWVSFITNIVTSIGVITIFVKYWLDKRMYKFTKLHEKREKIIDELYAKLVSHLINTRTARYFEQINLGNVQDIKEKSFHSFEELYVDYSVKKIFFGKSIEDVDKLLLPYRYSLFIWNNSSLNMENPEVVKAKTDSIKIIDQTIDLLNMKFAEEFKKILGVK